MKPYRVKVEHFVIQQEMAYVPNAMAAVALAEIFLFALLVLMDFTIQLDWLTSLFV